MITEYFSVKTITFLCIFVLSMPLSASAGQENPIGTAATAGQPVQGAETGENGWWAGLPKEKKMLYTTSVSAAAIAIWGLATWDYGSSGLHGSDEGFFEADAKYGGADKCGHFFASYAFSDALTGLYHGFGYDSRVASRYGVLSAWLVQAFMELGDATSESQGFSNEDMLMNTLGCLTSLAMQKYPDLDRKIDFRVEYVFNVAVGGIFDDYTNQYYSMVLKLDGFDAIKNNFLKYLEFSVGYYSRGYDNDSVAKKRSIYAGVSLNLSRLLFRKGYQKTGKLFEYFQLPYTVIKASRDLD